jgi:hypothetical protein
MSGPVALASTLLGLAVVGIEFGYLQAHRAGWNLGAVDLPEPHQGDDSRHPTLGRRSVLPELKALMSLLPLRTPSFARHAR